MEISYWWANPKRFKSKRDVMILLPHDKPRKGWIPVRKTVSVAGVKIKPVSRRQIEKAVPVPAQKTPCRDDKIIYP